MVRYYFKELQWKGIFHGNYISILHNFQIELQLDEGKQTVTEQHPSKTQLTSL